MYRPSTHHGYAFVIDTADWGNHAAAAETAADTLETWLESLDAGETAALHAALTAELDGRDDPNNPPAIVERARAAGGDAKKAALEAHEFAMRAMAGFNCDLAAQ